MTWTRFMDMHSGGGSKEKWQYIYIEAPIKEAEAIFYNRFGHNPYRVTCTCCGSDYVVYDEGDSLYQATAFERGCAYDKETNLYIESPRYKDMPHLYRTLEEWLHSDESLLICAEDIKPDELLGDLPQQGYVWAD